MAEPRIVTPQEAQEAAREVLSWGVQPPDIQTAPLTLAVYVAALEAAPDHHVVSKPHVVTAQEAQCWLDTGVAAPQYVCLAHTTATEPERTRAAAAKALRDYADMLNPLVVPMTVGQCQRLAREVADEIEQPAPIAHDDGTGFYRLDASTTGVG